MQKRGCGNLLRQQEEDIMERQSVGETDRQGGGEAGHFCQGHGSRATVHHDHNHVYAFDGKTYDSTCQEGQLDQN